ncbi:coiled-coil domain-containing protein [Floccifex sp.]|uniref:coiled-coil domain-containing protein n=1 Tax=Floccifex sp. TaxID=2815810 RepID=UPI003F0964BF
MTRKETEQDEISRLLDSYEDETLNQKMDAFAQSKKKRINKNVKKEAEIPSFVKKENVSDTPIVLSAKDCKQEQSSNLSGTRAFNPKNINTKEESVSGTVVIDDNEIQSLLDDQKGPQLTRKKVSKKQEEPKEDFHLKKTSSAKPAKKQGGGKTIAVIVASVLGILLTILLIFGVVKIVQNFAGDNISSEMQEQYYQEIMDWVDNYDLYDDEEKLEIIDLESKFNKLTDSQKEDIDTALIQKTGYSFDELLAKAKSKKKEDSKNNNTENAVKKAELKEKINDLKTDLSRAQSDLDDAQETLDQATSAYNKAVTAYNNEESTVNSYTSTIATYQSYQNTYNAKYAEYLNTDYSDTETRDAIWKEVESAKANMDSIQSDYNTAVNNLNSAQSKMESAKSTMNDAKSNMDSAKQVVDEKQSVVDELKNKISVYQQQLDELD